MRTEAAKHLAEGIAWFGFWLFLGLANFGNGDIISTFFYKIFGIN